MPRMPKISERQSRAKANYDKLDSKSQRKYFTGTVTQERRSSAPAASAPAAKSHDAISIEDRQDYEKSREGNVRRGGRKSLYGY